VTFGTALAGTFPVHQEVQVVERLAGGPRELRVLEALESVRAQQPLQRRRQLTVDLRHALVNDPLLAGRVDEEEGVGVLDVERLGLVGQPVDVGRLALGARA
jgi:hypothetical protein